MLYKGQGLSVKCMVLIAKLSVKNMSNVSQMKAWVFHNGEEGFVKTVLPVVVRPIGVYQVEVF